MNMGYKTMNKDSTLCLLLSAVAALLNIKSAYGGLYRQTRDDRYYYNRYGSNYPSAAEEDYSPNSRYIPSPKYIPGSKYSPEPENNYHTGWDSSAPDRYNPRGYKKGNSNHGYSYNEYSSDSHSNRNSGFLPSTGYRGSGYPSGYGYPGSDSPPAAGHAQYPGQGYPGPNSGPRFFSNAGPGYPSPGYPSNLNTGYSGSGSGYPVGPDGGRPSHSGGYKGSSVSGSGYPYNSGSWNFHQGISSYGWDSSKKPTDSLCNICHGAVSPQRGEYRGNGYDNLSPEWALKHNKNSNQYPIQRPGQWDKGTDSGWNKYPQPTDYNRGNSGGRYPSASWDANSGYNSGGGSGGGNRGQSWDSGYPRRPNDYDNRGWDKRPNWNDRRPGFNPRPYDDKKGIYPVKSTPGSGYWDSHPPREIGWESDDAKVGVVSGWIGGPDKGGKGGYSETGYKDDRQRPDDYERKTDQRYPGPVGNRGFGGYGGYEVARVTSGYVYMPNSVDSRPWDGTTKGYSNWDRPNKGYGSPPGRPDGNWGPGYNRDYASKWDYNAPPPSQSYDRPDPYDRRPDSYDRRPSSGCPSGCRPIDSGHNEDSWRETGGSHDGYPSRRPDPPFPPSGPGDYDGPTRFPSDRLPPPTRFNGHSGVGASTEYGYLYRGSYQQDRSSPTTVASASTTVITSTQPPTE